VGNNNINVALSGLVNMELCNFISQHFTESYNQTIQQRLCYFYILQLFM